MGVPELRISLQEVGFDSVVDNVHAEFVTFDYDVDVGARTGELVRIGLQGTDWPINPPGGVHVSPRIQHPGDHTHHVSPLGDDWIYWSRPYPDWAQSHRDIDEYLAHLRSLFAQFPTATAA